MAPNQSTSKSLSVSSNVPAYFIDGHFFSNIEGDIYNLNFMQKVNEDQDKVNLSVVSSIRLNLNQIKDLQKSMLALIEENEKNAQ